MYAFFGVNANGEWVLSLPNSGFPDANKRNVSRPLTPRKRGTIQLARSQWNGRETIGKVFEDLPI